MSAILILCQDKPEIDAPGSLHHIIIRGIERKRIFGDDKDRDNFLERLGNIITPDRFCANINYNATVAYRICRFFQSSLQATWKTFSKSI